MSEAIDLLERAFAHEAAGKTAVSPRTHVDLEGGGSMRILLAADYESGYYATKAYNRTPGVGTRYVVSLYRMQDGELLALIDARTITDLRTGAASGVIARKVPIAGPVTVAVIGASNQGRTQLRSIAAAYQVESATVYSLTVAECEAYAQEMSAELGFPITVGDSVKNAVLGRTVVVTASRARGEKPILYGEWLGGCRLLCAIGNTRPQFSEADVQCFRDAKLVVVDSLNAWKATGELIQAAAAGAVPEARRATLADIVSGATSVPAEGMVVYKAVGTALEDLAVAARYYELLGSRPELVQTLELGTLR
jgi:ornithine cyclodeaminase/alanine dehydrogenase